MIENLYLVYLGCCEDVNDSSLAYELLGTAYKMSRTFWPWRATR